jgi:hypothetical protein
LLDDFLAEPVFLQEVEVGLTLGGQVGKPYIFLQLLEVAKLGDDILVVQQVVSELPKFFSGQLLVNLLEFFAKVFIRENPGLLAFDLGL